MRATVAALEFIWRATHSRAVTIDECAGWNAIERVGAGDAVQFNRDLVDDVRSDFDFLVSFKSEARRQAFDNFFDLKEGLAKVLGRSVDLLTADALRNPFLAREIETSRQNLYGA